MQDLYGIPLYKLHISTSMHKELDPNMYIHITYLILTHIFQSRQRGLPPLKFVQYLGRQPPTKLPEGVLKGPLAMVHTLAQSEHARCYDWQTLLQANFKETTYDTTCILNTHREHNTYVSDRIGIWPYLKCNFYQVVSHNRVAISRPLSVAHYIMHRQLLQPSICEEHSIALSMGGEDRD